MQKLHSDDILLRTVVFNKLKLINCFIREKYPLIVTDAKPQKFMGCFSNNFVESLKLGYEYGLPYYTILTNRGKYRGLHIYLTTTTEWKWIHRELFVAHQLAKNGYCVIFCKTNEKIKPLIVEYLHGPHKRITKICNKILRGDGIKSGFLTPDFVFYDKVKIKESDYKKKWSVEHNFHKFVIKCLKNEFPTEIIDGKAQGRLNSIFHQHSNTIGYMHGIFDIIIWGKKKTIFIELKVNDNTLSTPQKKVVDLLKNVSHVCAIEFNGTDDYTTDTVNGTTVYIIDKLINELKIHL